MEYFDKFKREKQANKNKQVSAKEKAEQQRKDESLGMAIRGDVLKRIYPNAIVNGVFVVPKNVHRIDMFACARQNSLKKVIMHDGIVYIGKGAFNDCENLEEVQGLENSNNLHAISGFEGCCNLRSITLPESIECVEFEAFQDASNLKNINIPAKCWGIAKRAFAGCSSLRLIELPAGIESINEEAFAGCKNATIIFMEDDKQLLSEYMNEQRQMNAELYDEDFESDQQYADTEDDPDARPPKPTPEELAQYYDDFNIRYRIIDIAGEKIVWPSNKLTVSQDAFHGVKEIISSNEAKLESAVKSGYIGKVSLAYPETNQLVSVDLGSIDQFNKDQKAQKREKYYSQFLIPPDGTTSWLINCEKNHYNVQGYAGTLIWETPIYNDATISIIDYTQPKCHSFDKYSRDEEEFFTCVTFNKKEMVVDSIYPDHEYTRGYSFYYPFGARFDTNMLTQIGMALSVLIDTARSIKPTEKNQEEIALIAQKQKQIIDLFITGTKNKNAVANIMNDQNLHLVSPTRKPKPAKYKKDYLPYFNEPLFDEFENLEKYRKQQKEKQAKEKGSD